MKPNVKEYRALVRLTYDVQVTFAVNEDREEAEDEAMRLAELRVSADPLAGSPDVEVIKLDPA